MTDPGPLRRLQLELVNVCNYRCPLCRTLRKDGVVRRRMPLEEVEQVIAPVAAGLEEVTLHGTRGEPFLHPDLGGAVALIKRLSQARVELSTNGSKATPERARGVLDAGIDRIVFAIDGLSQETYARYRVGGELEQVLSNVRALCELKECGGQRTQVVFQLIPMAHNEAEIPRLAELAYGLGVDQVRLKVSSSVSRSEGHRPTGAGYRTDSFAPPAPTPCGFSCSFGLDQLYVDPNGDVFPCCYAEGLAEHRVGNALSEPLDAIWRGEALRPYREPFRGRGAPTAFCVATCAKRAVKRKLKLARPPGVASS